MFFLHNYKMSIVKSFIRSPHLLEVFIAYGGVHFISVMLMLFYYQVSCSVLFSAYVAGSAVYTFIEYVFHRYILHEWIFRQAHEHHHKNPMKLKIIATPLLPVQLYEFCLMVMISYCINPYSAVYLQVGISISQIIMDVLHVCEHSQYNPWF